MVLYLPPDGDCDIPLSLNLKKIKMANAKVFTKEDLLKDGGFKLGQAVLASIGIKLIPIDETRFKNIRSPFRNDQNPSLSVYKTEINGKWYFKDFGDPECSGDMITLASKVLGIDDLPFPEVIQQLGEYLENHNVNLDEVEELEVSAVKNQVLYVPIVKEDYSKEFLFYWNQYGVDQVILEELNVKELKGYSKLVDQSLKGVTNFEKGIHIYFESNGNGKYYCPNPKSFMWMGKKKSSPYLFSNMGDYADEVGENLILTGGEKDVLTLASLGFKAGCLNSETSKVSQEIQRTIYEGRYYGAVLYDNDETGRSSTEKIANSTGYTVLDLREVLKEGESAKDVSEYIKNGYPKERLVGYINSKLNGGDSQEVNPKGNPKNDDEGEALEVNEVASEEDEDSFQKLLPYFFQKAISKFNTQEEKNLVLLSTMVLIGNYLPEIYTNYGGKKLWSNLYLLISGPASSGKGVMRHPISMIKNYEKLLNEKPKVSSEDNIEDTPIYWNSLIVSGNISIAALCIMSD